MTFKQWTAIIELATDAVVAGLVLLGLPAKLAGEAGPAEVAASLLWAGLALVAITIAAAIATAIVGSIVTGRQFKDERSDERDRSIYARGMRNAYFVGSLGGLATLVALALGYAPGMAAYVLFFGGMLAGAVSAGSRLYYYRVG